MTITAATTPSEQRVEDFAKMLLRGLLCNRDPEVFRDRAGSLRIAYRVVGTRRGTIWLHRSKDLLRVNIRALSPKWASVLHYYDLPPLPNGNFSVDRPKNALENDVIRRIIQPYESAVLHIDQKLRAHIARGEAKKSSIDEVTSVLGDMARRARREWGNNEATEQAIIYHQDGRAFSGTFESQFDEKVTVELRSLPRELAVAIARVLRDYEDGA